MLPKEIEDIIEKESEAIDNQDYEDYDESQDWCYSVSCFDDEDEEWEHSSC